MLSLRYAFLLSTSLRAPLGQGETTQRSSGHFHSFLSYRSTRVARLVRGTRLYEPEVQGIRELLRFICGQLLLGC